MLQMTAQLFVVMVYIPDVGVEVNCDGDGVAVGEI